MNFVEKYFIEPTINQTGYNLVNTSVYSLIFILCLLATLKFFERSKTKLDKKVWYDLLPFVFLGGILRTLFDLNLFSSLGVFQYFFITPLIYVTIALLVIVCSFANKFFKNFLKYSGIILCSFFGVIVLLFSKNYQTFLLTLLFSLAVYLSTVLILKFTGLKRIYGDVNSHVIFGHILDACVATIAVQQGFTESQVLSSALMSISPLLFIAIKTIVPSILLYYIDKVKGNSNFILKFSLLTLGLPQGIHGALLLLTA